MPFSGITNSILRVRRDIDNLNLDTIGQALPDELNKTVRANIGTYFTTEYKIFNRSNPLKKCLSQRCGHNALTRRSKCCPYRMDPLENIPTPGQCRRDLECGSHPGGYVSFHPTGPATDK